MGRTGIHPIQVAQVSTRLLEIIKNAAIVEIYSDKAITRYSQVRVVYYIQRLKDQAEGQGAEAGVRAVRILAGCFAPPYRVIVQVFARQPFEDQGQAGRCLENIMQCRQSRVANAGINMAGSAERLDAARLLRVLDEPTTAS